MTRCGEDEFTCEQGSCVSMDLRCDGKKDCEDGTDETDCSRIRIFEGYNKKLIPLPLEGQVKFYYNISINISKIISIDEIDGKFKTKMTIGRYWFNPQLTYLDLHKSDDKNDLTLDDKNLMWIPRTVFHNLESGKGLQKTDKLDVLRIIPNSVFEFERSEKTENKNARIFKGSNNGLSYQREFSVKWMCDFDLAWYPFDSQICSFQFYDTGKLVNLVPVYVGYFGPKQLSQHFFKSVSICSKRIENRSGVVVEVYLGRPLFGSILNTFVPTTILVVLSMIIGKFRNDHLEMVIEVNLTILLDFV